MAIISACKSWMFKVGKNQFYWVFCQDISVTFIFTVVFKVDTFLFYFILFYVHPLSFGLGSADHLLWAAMRVFYYPKECQVFTMVIYALWSFYIRRHSFGE
jgi:hypothetical protein